MTARLAFAGSRARPGVLRILCVLLSSFAASGVAARAQAPDPAPPFTAQAPDPAPPFTAQAPDPASPFTAQAPDPAPPFTAQAPGPTEPVAARQEARVGFYAPDFELPDLSAWTLRGGELELGPTSVRYGMFGLFQIGSRFALNLFGALNAEAKWTIYAGDRVGIGVEGGLLRFDPALVGIDDDFDVWAFPVALRVSGRPSEPLRLHGAIEFLSARSNNDASDAVRRIQRYLGPVGKLALHLGAEWRFTPHLGVLAEVEAPLIQHVSTFRYPGEDAFGDFMRAKLSLLLVYESLNVRIGGGYGPSFLGRAGLFPVVELALRLY